MHHQISALVSATVHPGFPEILKQIRPEEAKLLVGLVDSRTEDAIQWPDENPFPSNAYVSPGSLSIHQALQIWDQLGYSKSGSAHLTHADSVEQVQARNSDIHRLMMAMDNLVRLGLCEIETQLTIPFPEDILKSSARGYAHSSEMAYKMRPRFRVTNLGSHFVKMSSKPSLRRPK